MTVPAPADAEFELTLHVPWLVEIEVWLQFGGTSDPPHRRVSAFSALPKLDPDDGVAGDEDPDALNGSNAMAVLSDATPVRVGALGPAVKYAFTTPGPPAAIEVEGETADRAAPVPLALV